MLRRICCVLSCESTQTCFPSSPSFSPPPLLVGSPSFSPPPSIGWYYLCCSNGNQSEQPIILPNPIGWYYLCCNYGNQSKQPIFPPPPLLVVIISAATMGTNHNRNHVLSHLKLGCFTQICMLDPNRMSDL